MTASTIAAAALAIAATVAAQAGPLRGPATAAPASTVYVDVASNEPSITLVNPATGQVTAFPVGPGKRAEVFIPLVPPGTVLFLVAGRGANAHVGGLVVL
jgi:hypothetical protein